MSNALTRRERFTLFTDKLRYRSGFGFLQTIVVIILTSVVGVLIISRLLLDARIYIPGLYFIPQTIAYQLDTGDSIGPFYYRDFLFFFIGWAINIPLIAGAYFLIGKKYALTTFLALSIWTSMGLLFSVEVIKESINYEKIRFFDFSADNAQRTKQVQYYIIAFFSGLISGFTISFIWRQNISMGGLDVIFTYLSIKTKKEIQKITLPVAACFALLSIIVNEYEQTNWSLQTFLSLFFASVLFSYIRNLTISYFYPKFKLITIFIITKKPDQVRKELNQFYLHGGNMIATRGLYDQKDKTIIITTMSYLEKDAVISRIKRIDSQAFFMGNNASLLKGRFVQK